MSATPLDPREGSFTARLKALHEISMELSQAADVDSLCRRAVELGRERLGLDRIGIWFIDPADPEGNIGTWGVDEGGCLRDEREARVKRDILGAPPGYFEGAVPLRVLEEDVCYDERHQPVGGGTRVLAPLWDGQRMFGELAVDDLFHHRGFDEPSREIIVLFARIVAHLTTLKRTEAELRLLASTDSLTGTVNRRTALIILDKQLGLCLRSSSPLSVCMADIDGLKLINDALGHRAGDDYIKVVCAALVGAVRASDTVGRLGGDEFIVVFPDCRTEEAAAIMGRVDRSLDEAADNLPYRPSLSWGLAAMGELPGPCAQTLLELADRRMYERKRGRSAVQSRLGSPR